MSWFKARQLVMCVGVAQMPRPTRGATKVFCAGCNTVVWLSAATRQMVERRFYGTFEDVAEPRCWVCIPDRALEAGPQPLSDEQLDEFIAHWHDN